jgi:hypothetical protein
MVESYVHYFGQVNLLQMMRSKIAIKAWVVWNTGFSTPRTLYGPFSPEEFEGALAYLDPGPQMVVLKPITQNSARGVRILHQPTRGVWANPWTGGASTALELKRSVMHEIRDQDNCTDYNRFIIEEYVRSHESLRQMAPLQDASPTLRCVYWGDRFIGGLIHLPTLASQGVSNLAKGANWMAFDADGIIQRVPIEERRSWKKSHYKELELHEYETWINCKILNWCHTKTGINSRIVPYVMKGLNDLETPFWTVDGILNEAGKFVVIEMEHPPGSMFKQAKPFME